MDPVTFLYSLERLGMKFGLEHISRLCEALDHPERAFQSIIVAGTNGKGSVTAMTETALRAAGRRTGRYTSPHLTRLEERFVIDGREVDGGTLRGALARVQDAAAALRAQGETETLPTFFECATATAFELFRRAGIEIAVLEVGLGGRLDATNVVTPIAAAITSIAFDHQAQLGHTLASIAREKAGVIKPGIPVVCGPVPDEAAAVIREAAAERGATLLETSERVRIVTRDDGSIDFACGELAVERVRLALAGRHQVDNAAVALCLLDLLRPRAIAVDAAAARAGLAEVDWPGRLERRAWRGAEVILDAAHNPAGAAALASYLAEIGWTSVVLLVGAMRDKDAAAMLREVAPVCRHVVCTTPASPRAMPAAELAGVASTIARCPVEAVDPPEAAADRARALGDRLVAAGSIFLIGPLRGILR